MTTWTDAFTGMTYRLGENWLGAVRSHLARKMAQEIISSKGNPQVAADQVAAFWREDFYQRLFPLRFGLRQVDGQIDGVDLFPDTEAGEIDLEALTGQPLRENFLDGEGLPLILPVTSHEHELLADHALATAGVINLVLRREIPDHLFHQVRLGTLIDLLVETLEEAEEEETVRQIQAAFPAAWQVARLLAFHHQGREGDMETLPAGLDPAKLSKLHDFDTEDQVTVVVAAVQRIKQFVFETPGLNEIRGASTLLDDLIEKLAAEVSRKLGPEVLIQAAASTLIFLAPPEEAEAWKDNIKQRFFQTTGTAFIAVGVHTTAVRLLDTAFQEVMGGAYRDLEHDRCTMDLPCWETLPFEERCWICRSRPAEGWDQPPEGPPAGACRVCITKRKIGQPGKLGKVQRVLDWLGLDKPAPLGVKGEQAEDYVAGKLEELIPPESRRKLLATIYGDGDNFGKVAQKLSSLPLALQWTHRVEKTTQAAAALALAQATQAAAGRRRQQPGTDPVLDKLPFQVLALGGDDLIFITAGELGLRVCERFLYLTDLEFQRGPGRCLTDTPLSFSLGCLLADEKAPVRRTVRFTEDELLKWAKRAGRRRSALQAEGMVAYLLALTPEQIPPDLSYYQEQVFLSPQDSLLNLCHTLRPFSRKELNFLLEKAAKIGTSHLGRLHRLVAVFVQSPPLTACLHYVYQKSREREPKREQLTFMIEAGEQVGEGDGKEVVEWGEVFYGMGDSKLYLPAMEFSRREPFGEPMEQSIAVRGRMLFSPLWDLLEIIKAQE